MVISWGPLESCLLASRHVTVVTFQAITLPTVHKEAQMKSLKYVWQNDVQERIMHLVPIKMLEEKRV